VYHRQALNANQSTGLAEAVAGNTCIIRSRCVKIAA
jgi:hypothetical protein